MFATHPQITELCRAEGYVYWHPTNLSAEATWGTLLGFSRNGLTLLPGIKTVPVRAEGTGRKVIKLIFGGYNLTVTSLLRNYNTTALARLFPGLVVGTKVTIPGGVKPGRDLMNNYSDNLLFVPSDQTNNPAILMQCTPHIVEATKLFFSHQNTLEFPAIFWLKNTCQVGKLGELVL